MRRGVRCTVFRLMMVHQIGSVKVTVPTPKFEALGSCHARCP